MEACKIEEECVLSYGVLKTVLQRHKKKITANSKAFNACNELVLSM